MAFQATHWQLHNEFVPTYESCSTRQFYHGRTEVIFPATNEAMRFARALADGSKPIGLTWFLLQFTQLRLLFLLFELKSKIVVAGLLRDAAETHVQLAHEAADGQGCARHLFGLAMMSRDAGLTPPAVLDTEAYKTLTTCEFLSTFEKLWIFILLYMRASSSVCVCITTV